MLLVSDCRNFSLVMKKKRISERSQQTRISSSFSTCQVSISICTALQSLPKYLRTDIDIECHSVSVQSTFATCIVYKLHCEVGSVLIIHLV